MLALAVVFLATEEAFMCIRPDRTDAWRHGRCHLTAALVHFYGKSLVRSLCRSFMNLSSALYPLLLTIVRARR